MHALNDDSSVIMLLEGTLAEVMVKVAPHSYKKFVPTGKSGQKLQYVQMHKAIYGMLKIMFLFYKKLLADLKSQCFEINPYDPCVANKIQAESSLS